MKLHYYPETDSLYIELKDGPGVETREVTDGVVIDLDEKGEVVGLDLSGASKRFDLGSIELGDLPLQPKAA